VIVIGMLPFNVKYLVAVDFPLVNKTKGLI
jgi:hypothetical protein